MPAGSSDTTGFLVVDLARLFRHAFECAVAHEGLELTAGEARTLLHASYAGPIRQHHLADRMRVEPTTLCSFLDRLEGRPTPAAYRVGLRRSDVELGRYLAAVQCIAASGLLLPRIEVELP